VSAAEKRYLARDEESEGVEVARSRGSYLIDAHGKKYIDFVMGWCVGNLGWNSIATRAAIRRFAGPDYGFPGYSLQRMGRARRAVGRYCPRQAH